MELLAGAGIALLVDVRTVPRSARNPQFDRMVLPATLAAAGIGYLHLAELGGLRKPHPSSPNRGWKSDAFRGYADQMGSAEFGCAIAQLLDLARTRRVAVMCVEAVPWRCHRALLADALTVRGVTVVHLLPGGRREPHRLTTFAQVEGLRITYPPVQGELLPEEEEEEEE